MCDIERKLPRNGRASTKPASVDESEISIKRVDWSAPTPQRKPKVHTRPSLPHQSSVRLASLTSLLSFVCQNLKNEPCRSFNSDADTAVLIAYEIAWLRRCFPSCHKNTSSQTPQHLEVQITHRPPSNLRGIGTRQNCSSTPLEQFSRLFRFRLCFEHIRLLRGCVRVSLTSCAHDVSRRGRRGHGGLVICLIHWSIVVAKPAKNGLSLPADFAPNKMDAKTITGCD